MLTVATFVLYAWFIGLTFFVGCLLSRIADQEQRIENLQEVVAGLKEDTRGAR